jgi:hypothetical protein
MKRFLFGVAGFFLSTSCYLAAQDLASVVERTVKKVDAAANIIVVRAADGTDDTFYLADRTAVHGTEAAAKGTKGTFHGLKEGSEVVVHHVGSGTDPAAEEIDHIGKGCRKAPHLLENSRPALAERRIRSANHIAFGASFCAFWQE